MADLKERRQRAIADLIRSNALSSQEELAERLGSMGFAVTQATISRDLEQIGAVKVRRKIENPCTLWTVQDLGEAWTDGTLAKEFPDQIHRRRSERDDEIRLERHVYPSSAPCACAISPSRTWVADRTGHKSHGMIKRYTRQARTAGD
jgi:hypothetical protein